MDSQADKWTLTIPMSPPNFFGVDKNVIFDLVPNWTIISWGPINISSTMDYVMAWHLTGCIFNEELGHPVGAKPLTKPGLLMLSLRKYFKENKKVTPVMLTQRWSRSQAVRLVRAASVVKTTVKPLV